MKRLVYFTVGVSAGYADLLRLVVHSLRRTTPDVDILILCDAAYAPHIADVGGHRHLTAPNGDGVTTSMRKLEVFDWPGLSDYEAVVFLDCDIVVQDDLGPVFDAVGRDDVLYTVPVHGVHAHANRELSLGYSAEQLAWLSRRGKAPFSAGHFAFRPTAAMRAHFETVRRLVEVWDRPFFYEQSFLNHHFNLADATDESAFRGTVLLDADEASQPGPNVRLLHFSTALLPWRTKLAMMRVRWGRRTLADDVWEALVEAVLRSPGPIVLAGVGVLAPVAAESAGLWRAVGLAAVSEVGEGLGSVLLLHAPNDVEEAARLETALGAGREVLTIGLDDGEVPGHEREGAAAFLTALAHAVLLSQGLGPRYLGLAAGLAPLADEPASRFIRPLRSFPMAAPGDALADVAEAVRRTRTELVPVVSGDRFVGHVLARTITAKLEQEGPEARLDTTTVRPFPARIGADASMRQAAAALSMRGLAGYAAVTDDEGRAVGLLLAQDLFAAASRAA